MLLNNFPFDRLQIVRVAHVFDVGSGVGIPTTTTATLDFTIDAMDEVLSIILRRRDGWFTVICVGERR